MGLENELVSLLLFGVEGEKNERVLTSDFSENEMK
jgi:hypothetical protein